MSVLPPSPASQASADAGKPAISTRRLTFILGALTAFAPFSIDMYLSGFPAIARSLGAEASQVQLSLAAFFFGVALGQLIYGPAIDRFGRRIPMLIGITIYIFASGLLMLAPDINIFIGLRFVQALGACAGMVVARAMIRDLFDAREGAMALSMMMAVVALGPIVAPVLGSLILSWSYWQAIFAFLTLFGLGCLYLAYQNLAETLPPEQRVKQNLLQVFATFGRLLIKRSFMVPALAGAFAFSGVFAYVTAAPFVLMELHGLNQQVFGGLFALIACGLILANYVNRRLLIRSTPNRILALGILINISAGVLLVLFNATESLPLLASILAIWVATMPLIGSNAVAVAMAESGPFAGSASSLVGVSQFGTASIVSAIVGATYDGTAMPMSAIMLGCGLISGLMLLVGQGKTDEVYVRAT